MRGRTVALAGEPGEKMRKNHPTQSLRNKPSGRMSLFMRQFLIPSLISLVISLLVTAVLIALLFLLLGFLDISLRDYWMDLISLAAIAFGLGLFMYLNYYQQRRMRG